MAKVRRVFSPEFKQEAVRLITDEGRPMAQVARDLEVRPEQLRLWRQQRVAAGTVTASTRPETAEEELRRVKRELEVVRQERDFLKKATAFFAKGSA
jgi:transposase